MADATVRWRPQMKSLSQQLLLDLRLASHARDDVREFEGVGFGSWTIYE
jgi:hypothetical protein